MKRRLRRAVFGGLPGIIELATPAGLVLIGLQFLGCALGGGPCPTGFLMVVRYAPPFAWGLFLATCGLCEWLIFLVGSLTGRRLTMRLVAFLWLTLAVLFAWPSLLAPVAPLCLVLSGLCAWAALALDVETEPWKDPTQPPLPFSP